jgi:outer membrane protein
MTNGRILLFSSLLFILIGFQSSAQQAWSLQQCIDYALLHNITIKQTELSKQLAEENYNQSIATMFPTLNGSASQNWYYGRSIDPTTNIYTNNSIRSNSFSLTSNVALFEGFQLQNTLKQSKLNYLSSQYDLQKVQNDISLNVATYYLQVLYNDELLIITKEKSDATKVERDKTQRMYELGSVSKGNLLDLEAQLAMDEVTLINAQTQYDQALLSLTQLLELDTTKGFSIQKPNVDIPSSIVQPDLDSVYNVALKTQPDIKSSEYKVLSAEKGLSIARGVRYPRIYLGGSLSTNYSSSSRDFYTETLGPPIYRETGITSAGDTVLTLFPNTALRSEYTSFSKQWDNNLSKSFGFSLSLPLFNGWSAKYGIRRAKIGLEQSKLSHQAIKNSLFKSVQQAVADVVASHQKYEANSKNVESQEEAFKFSNQRFDVGLLSTYDFLLAKNNLAKAKADLLQAKYDYIFRVKVLDFYNGKPLTF